LRRCLAPSPARLHAVNVLAEWGLGDLADDAALVVSDSLNLTNCFLWSVLVV
jgi:hypothetical protein